MSDKKTLYTAIKPTGRITLGNYIGAVKGLMEYSDQYQTIIAVANLHALTMNMPKEELLSNTNHIFAFYLALGLNANNTVFYLQSDVKEHSELNWVLSNYIGFGELSRMTQFKDYQAKSKHVNAGLFTYPVLMAGDILLFDTHVVPVGIDQKQHVELARNVAQKFNGKFGDVFVVPEPLLPKQGAKIAGLQDPTKKMSKSADADTGTIFFEDTPEEVVKKLKRAVTDSENIIKYDPENKPGVSNLLTIYATLKNIKPQDAEKDFAGMGYGQLKLGVADVINKTFAPIKEKYEYYVNNPDVLKQEMANGAKKASDIAGKKMKQVYDIVGIPAN